MFQRTPREFAELMWSVLNCEEKSALINAAADDKLCHIGFNEDNPRGTWEHKGKK